MVVRTVLGQGPKLSKYLTDPSPPAPAIKGSPPGPFSLHFYAECFEAKSNLREGRWRSLELLGRFATYHLLHTTYTGRE